VENPVSDCGTCGDAKVLKGRIGVETRIVRCPDCTPPPTRDKLLIGVSQRVTFDDWIANPGMLESEMRVRELLAGERWCVFLRGDVGIGKSMLAKCAAWEFTATGEVAIFVNVPDFLAALKETFEFTADGKRYETTRDTYAARFETYALAGLLVLDDFGAEYRTHWAQAELYRLLERRHEARRPTIVTSNEKFDDDLDRRILSRLGPGEVVIKGVQDRRKEFER